MSQAFWGGKWFEHNRADRYTGTLLLQLAVFATNAKLSWVHSSFLSKRWNTWFAASSLQKLDLSNHLCKTWKCCRLVVQKSSFTGNINVYWDISNTLSSAGVNFFLPLFLPKRPLTTQCRYTEPLDFIKTWRTRRQRWYLDIAILVGMSRSETWFLIPLWLLIIWIYYNQAQTAPFSEDLLTIYCERIDRNLKDAVNTHAVH